MWTPYFCSCASPQWRAHFFYFEIDLYIYLFLENDLESPIIFVLFLKVNKIRKKILSVTSYLEKAVCEKPNMGSGARLLIGKVR